MNHWGIIAFLLSCSPGQSTPPIIALCNLRSAIWIISILIPYCLVLLWSEGVWRGEVALAWTDLGKAAGVLLKTEWIRIKKPVKKPTGSTGVAVKIGWISGGKAGRIIDKKICNTSDTKMHPAIMRGAIFLMDKLKRSDILYETIANILNHKNTNHKLIMLNNLNPNICWSKVSWNLFNIADKA